MAKCKQCPHAVGDSYQRDCCFPDCIGWSIEYNPKPIPDRRFDYDYWHDDYDGSDGGNGLCGTASSVVDAMEQIAEIEADRE
jgi:hypothetical protein